MTWLKKQTIKRSALATSNILNLRSTEFRIQIIREDMLSSSRWCRACPTCQTSARCPSSTPRWCSATTWKWWVTTLCRTTNKSTVVKALRKKCRHSNVAMINSVRTEEKVQTCLKRRWTRCSRVCHLTWTRLTSWRATLLTPATMKKELTITLLIPPPPSLRPKTKTSPPPWNHRKTTTGTSTTSRTIQALGVPTCTRWGSRSRRPSHLLRWTPLWPMNSSWTQRAIRMSRVAFRIPHRLRRLLSPHKLVLAPKDRNKSRWFQISPRLIDSIRSSTWTNWP